MWLTVEEYITCLLFCGLRKPQKYFIEWKFPDLQYCVSHTNYISYMYTKC